MAAPASETFRIYTVHGTFAADKKKRDEGPRWWQRGSDFSEALLSYLDRDRVDLQPFHWSGANSARGRIAAGEELHAVIDRLDAEPGPSPVFLCHSHGGTVFAHATYGGRGARKRQGRPWPDAITVGTPYLAELPVRLPLAMIRIGLFLALFAILWALRLLSDHPVVASAGPILALIVAGLLIFALFPLRVSRFAYRQIRLTPGIGTAKTLFLGVLDRFNARANAARPKLYVAADEAIMGLKLAHDRTLKIATARTMFSPVALALSVLGIVGLWFVRDALPPLLTSDALLVTAVSENQGDLRSVLIETVDFGADLVLLGPIIVAVAMLIARIGGASIVARAFNRTLTSVVRQRALGQDSWASGVFDVPADANLPLVDGDYEETARWRPLPDVFAAELDAIAADALGRSASQIRAGLAPVLLAGDGTDLQPLLQAGIDGDLLIHTAYFSHPDMPGFIAWMLVELCGLPPSPAYEALPRARFAEWYVHIAPDGAPRPGTGPAAGQEPSSSAMMSTK